MMKRMLTLLVALLLLGGTACAEGSISAGEKVDGGFSLVQLFGKSQETIAFSFAMPSGAHAAVVTLWVLRDGAWESRMCLPMCGDAGRIELNYGESLGTGLRMSLTSGGSCMSVEDGTKLGFSLRGMKSDRVFLSEPMAAVPETEYPIALQLHHSGSEEPEAALALYYAPESIRAGHAYAVTVCFTARTEAEIYGWGDEAVVDIDAVPGNPPVGTDMAPWVGSPVWSIPEHEGPEIVE